MDRYILKIYQSFYKKLHDFCKVGVGISRHSGVIPHRHKAKPVPIVKTCVPPCQGKTPCIRLCPDCPMRSTKNHWIKEIKGYKKYIDGDGNLGSKCLNLRGHTAKTFSGNTSGTFCFLEIWTIPFNRVNL